MTYTNNLKQFANTPMKIEKASAFYYTGYDATVEKFYTIIPTEDKMTVLRKEWNKDERKFTETPISLTWEEMTMKKADGKTEYTAETYVIEIEGKKYPFYKFFKKVYDLSIELEKEQELIKYKDVTEFDDKAIIQGVWVGKICWILEDVLDLNLPRDDNGFLNKGGEEGFLEALEWAEFKFTVKGQGLGTKYTWKEAKFNKQAETSWIKSMEWDDIIF